MFGRLILIGTIFGSAFVGGIACALISNQRRAQQENFREALEKGRWESEGGAPSPVLF